MRKKTRSLFALKGYPTAKIVISQSDLRGAQIVDDAFFPVKRQLIDAVSHGAAIEKGPLTVDRSTLYQHYRPLVVKRAATSAKQKPPQPLRLDDTWHAGGVWSAAVFARSTLQGLIKLNPRHKDLPRLLEQAADLQRGMRALLAPEDVKRLKAGDKRYARMVERFNAKRLKKSTQRKLPPVT
jgi:hypothetical protein